MSPAVCLAVRSQLLGVGSLGPRDGTQFVNRNVGWLGHLTSPTPLLLQSVYWLCVKLR